jgi:hypothetical protein
LHLSRKTLTLGYLYFCGLQEAENKSPGCSRAR